ncbi:LysR substrate-binding domain-containing protein, partial [Alphaproteobacteria bacterium]|nr:LysR substrate-binding domain-containing protein [Alphaproteobacteria bacterium]
KINYVDGMSQIEELRAFVLIVETGSLTQAADRMGIAVSAVSRRLRDLELRLGTALIQRSTRRLFLNETGQQFYQRAKTVLSTLEDAEQEAQNAGGALNGVLRISVPLSFGIAHMSTAIAQFMHAHPDIHIEMDLSDKRVDMIAEGFDAAIRIGNLTDSSLIAKKISSVSVLPVAAPSLISQWPQLNHPNDLANMPALVYANDRSSHDWHYVAPDGKAGSLNITPRMSANNGDVLRDLAVAGLGMVLLPNFLHYESINKGLLQPLFPDYDWSSFDIFVVYPKTTILPKRTRVFVDFISGLYGRSPYWEAIDRTALAG